MYHLLANGACWLLLAILLRAAPGVLQKHRVLTEVRRRRYARRTAGHRLVLAGNGATISGLVGFHILGLWLLPILLWKQESAFWTLSLVWPMLHYCLCCWCLPVKPAHFSLHPKGRHVSIPSMCCWQWTLLGYAWAFVGFLVPICGRAGLLAAITMLLREADPLRALIGRKCFQTGRSLAACLLWLFPLFAVCATDDAICWTMAALLSPLILAPLLRRFLAVREEPTAVVLYEEPEQFEDFVFTFHPGYALNVRGLNAMKLQLTKQQLVRDGYVPVQLRAPGVSDILAEALLATMQSDTVLPRAIGYTFWGRVHLQKLPWLIRLVLHILCRAAATAQRALRAALFFLQLNWNYAQRFQVPLPGEALMERIWSRRTATGFVLRLVVLSLRDNKLVPLDLLHVLLSGLFITDAWPTGEAWILSCTAKGALQLMSIFVISSSLRAMLPRHEWVDLQLHFLPRRVRLHLPSQSESVCMKFSESEAALKILLGLEALEREGVPIVTSFADHSINARSYAHLFERPRQHLWAYCGILDIARHHEQRAREILARNGNWDSDTEWSVTIHSLLYSGPEPLRGSRACLLVRFCDCMTVKPTASDVLLAALHNSLAKRHAADTVLLQGRGVWTNRADALSEIKLVCGLSDSIDHFDKESEASAEKCAQNVGQASNSPEALVTLSSPTILLLVGSAVLTVWYFLGLTGTLIALAAMVRALVLGDALVSLEDWVEISHAVPSKLPREGYVVTNDLQVGLSHFGTTGDAQTIRGFDRILRGYGIDTVWPKTLPVERATLDLSLIEAGSIIGSAQSLVRYRNFCREFIQTGASLVTAALNMPTTSVVQVRLYDAERIQPLTTGHPAIDVTNYALLESTHCVTSAAGEGNGVPYFTRPDVILRRLQRREMEYPDLVATGSATHVDLSAVPRSAVAHVSCTNSVKQHCSAVEHRTDHSTIFPAVGTVYGSGGTGVKMLANAAGCEFKALSHVLDRREDPEGPGADASVFESAEQGVFVAIASGSWLSACIMVLQAGEATGPYQLAKILIWMLAHVRPLSFCQAIGRLLVFSWSIVGGYLFWTSGQSLDRWSYDALVISSALAVIAPNHFWQLLFTGAREVIGGSLFGFLSRVRYHWLASCPTLLLIIRSWSAGSWRIGTGAFALRLYVAAMLACGRAIHETPFCLRCSVVHGVFFHTEVICQDMSFNARTRETPRGLEMQWVYESVADLDHGSYFTIPFMSSRIPSMAVQDYPHTGLYGACCNCQLASGWVLTHFPVADTYCAWIVLCMLQIYTLPALLMASLVSSVCPRFPKRLKPLYDYFHLFCMEVHAVVEFESAFAAMRALCRRLRCGNLVKRDGFPIPTLTCSHVIASSLLSLSESLVNPHCRSVGDMTPERLVEICQIQPAVKTDLEELLRVVVSCGDVLVHNRVMEMFELNECGHHPILKPYEGRVLQSGCAHCVVLEVCNQQGMVDADVFLSSLGRNCRNQVCSIQLALPQDAKILAQLVESAHGSVAVWWPAAEVAHPNILQRNLHLQVQAPSPSAVSMPFINIELFHEAFEEVMEAVVDIRQTSRFCFPTGGTLIGALRWGHVCGYTGKRWNVADADLDLVCLVADKEAFKQEVTFLSARHPALSFEWRDADKALTVKSRVVFGHVPDNHRNIWQDHGTACRFYGDIYIVQTNFETWTAELPSHVERDFEFWAREDHLDLREWESLLYAPSLVTLGGYEFLTPDNPEQSVLRKWQNQQWQQAQDLWIPYTDFIQMGGYFFEPFEGCDADELHTVYTSTCHLRERGMASFAVSHQEFLDASVGAPRPATHPHNFPDFSSNADFATSPPLTEVVVTLCQHRVLLPSSATGEQEGTWTDDDMVLHDVGRDEGFNRWLASWRATASQAEALLMLRVILARMMIWLSLVVHWLMHLLHIPCICSKLAQVAAEPTKLARLDRIKAGWIPGAIPAISPISMLPFVIAPPGPELAVYLGGQLVEPGTALAPEDLDRVTWFDGQHRHYTAEDVHELWMTRIQQALAKSGHVIDPGYRRRLGRNPYITETITQQQSEWLRTFGAVQGMDTSRVLPEIYEMFSMSRYKATTLPHTATVEDAVSTAEVLMDVYKGAFAGHQILSPLHCLKDRKKYVSPGYYLEGCTAPGTRRILRTIKDTMSPTLIEAQVALAHQIFESAILEPGVSMNVAKKYKEPEDRILQMLKPVRHFVSPISPLMLVQLSLFSSFDKGLKERHEAGWCMSGTPENAQAYNQLLDRIGPCRQKVKLDQHALDSNLVPELFHAHAHILSRNLVRATAHDRAVYEQRIIGELSRLQHGITVGIHSGIVHPKLKGGMTGSGTVYGLNITAVQVALTDSLAVSEGVSKQKAAEMLQGLFDGDDTIHGFKEPVSLERWFDICYQRWGIRPKLEWLRETDEPDTNWAGLPMRGWRVTSNEEIKPTLVKAGIFPDAPDFPSRGWVRNEAKLDMRYTVSTSRNWKSYHESLRSHAESCFMSPERFAMATKHLRQLRAEWRKLGPQARAFMKARPIPDRWKVVRRFYLGTKPRHPSRFLLDRENEQWTLVEETIASTLSIGLATLRSLASERLAAERLTLASSDAIYMTEAVAETHIFLSTHPEALLTFEQRCVASIFGSITKPTWFWIRAQSDPPLESECMEWSGKAQLLFATTIALGQLQRTLGRARVIGLVVRAYTLLTAGSGGLWTIISALAFLGPGTTDPRTANLVVKDSNIYRKILATVLVALVPTPLCILSVPQAVYVAAYYIVSALARLGATQLAIQPSRVEPVGERALKWEQYLISVLRTLRSHGAAAIQAPTGTGKGQILLPLLHKHYGTVLVLSPSRIARDSQPTATLDRKDENPCSGSMVTSVDGHCSSRLMQNERAFEEVDLIVIDEADLVRAPALYAAHRIRQVRPSTHLLLVSATYNADTLQHYGVRDDCLHALDLERPHPTTIVQDTMSTDLVMSLWVHLKHALQGKFLLQAATKREVTRTSERLESMQLRHQPVWSGVTLDGSAPGFVITELSRGVTFPGVTLAISGPRELYASAGILFAGPPSRATIIQRNGRVGRTGPGLAVNLHAGVERSIIPHPQGSEYLSDPEFWQKHFGILGMLVPFSATDPFVAVNPYWAVHGGLLTTLGGGPQAAPLLAELFHRTLSDESLLRAMTQRKLDASMHFEDLCHRNEDLVNIAVDKLNHLNFDWTSLRPFKVCRGGVERIFRTLSVRMHELIFDQPSHPVVQTELLEPEVFAARSLIDPLFGLPKNTRVIAPGAAMRHLTPEQTRLSALDLICYLHSGWPKGGSYVYGEHMPQKLRPIQIGDFDYIQRCCLWLVNQLQSPLTLHYLTQGASEARQKVFSEDLKSNRHVHLIADQACFAIVQVPQNTPEVTSYAYASTSVLQANILPSTHRAAGGSHEFQIGSPITGSDESEDLDEMIKAAAHAGMPSLNNTGTEEVLPSYSTISYAAALEAPCYGHNGDCRQVANDLLNIPLLSEVQANEFLEANPWFKAILQKVPLREHGAFMKLAKSWGALLRSGYALQVVATSKSLFRKSVSLVIQPNRWNGHYINLRLEWKHLALMKSQVHPLHRSIELPEGSTTLLRRRVAISSLCDEDAQRHFAISNVRSLWGLNTLVLKADSMSAEAARPWRLPGAENLKEICRKLIAQRCNDVCPQPELHGHRLYGCMACVTADALAMLWETNVAMIGSENGKQGSVVLHRFGTTQAVKSVIQSGDRIQCVQIYSPDASAVPHFINLELTAGHSWGSNNPKLHPPAPIDCRKRMNSTLDSVAAKRLRPY